MSVFSENLRRRACQFRDPKQILELLAECKRRIETFADRGQFAVSWEQIRQPNWNISRDTENLLLQRLLDEDVNVYTCGHDHVEACAPHEIELRW